MAFLLLGAFGSPAGQRVEKATNGTSACEDWNLIMEICDIINETEDGPKDAVKAIRKRLNGNKNPKEVILALTVLETCVKNCGRRVHILVAKQEFVESVLVRLIQPKMGLPVDVHDKVLGLIQTWADAFCSYPELSGVVQVCEDLKRKGVEFPMTDLDALSPIHTPQRSIPEVDPAIQRPKGGACAVGDIENVMATAPPVSPPVISPGGSDPIKLTPEQMGKLRSELDLVEGNVQVMSTLLTEVVPAQKQEQASDLQLLQDLNKTCRAMQQRVVELLDQVASAEITSELLRVNDDLNNVFLRFDRFERCQTGQAVQVSGAPTVSSSEPSDAAGNYSVSREASGPSLHYPTDPAVLSGLTWPNLSSQFANMSTSNGQAVDAGSTASEEASGHPSQAADDFDMFAQTRGNSMNDQRKQVVYEDPRAIEGLAGALGTRQQNTGAREEDGTGGTGSIDALQAFLSGRQGDAEQLPDLPTPPTSRPSIPTDVRARRKAESADESLFAL
uniref:TOM1-like protein 2 isoform X2 n=1 Tax=Myxine glutinosa TaxID=7769 RepID=UPI003590169C